MGQIVTHMSRGTGPTVVFGAFDDAGTNGIAFNIADTELQIHVIEGTREKPTLTQVSGPTVATIDFLCITHVQGLEDAL